MKPSTIRYFIREGLSGLKMNMLMTMASIVAVEMCIRDSLQILFRNEDGGRLRVCI